MGSECDRLFAATGMSLLLGQHGVPVTFIPAGGPPRTVTAILDYVREENQQAEGQEIEQEELWITVRRDPDAAEGGIGAIAIGDAIERLGQDKDDADSRWSWQQRVRDATADLWDLLFARKRPRRIGPRS
jgi:hypothetical protein